MFRLLLPTVVLAFVASTASATSIMIGDQDFANGTFPTLADYTNASAGEPAPFNAFCGSDVNGGPNCSANFTFAFAAPASASNASFTIGLFDHDSAAPGDQVALFSVAGIDLTTALNAALNGSGGSQAEANVYSVALPNTVLPAILAGNVAVVLNFTGPGLQGSAGQTGSTTTTNGVGLDFATLSFDTVTATVPEPATLVLFGTGIVAAIRRRYRR
jgi:hypothetical protein